MLGFIGKTRYLNIYTLKLLVCLSNYFSVTVLHSCTAALQSLEYYDQHYKVKAVLQLYENGNVGTVCQLWKTRNSFKHNHFTTKKPLGNHNNAYLPSMFACCSFFTKKHYNSIVSFRICRHCRSTVLVGVSSSI